MHGTCQASGGLDCEMQRRVSLNVAQAAVHDSGIDGCRKISWKEHDNVAVAGTQLRGPAKTNIPARGRSVRIDPGGDRTTGGSRLDQSGRSSRGRECSSWRVLAAEF